MAACTKWLDKCVFSSRLLRNVRLQHERFLSTSVCRLAAGNASQQPPKFTPPPKPVIIDKTQTVAALRKFLSPEFIPPRQRTNRLKFYMERKDMARRRSVVNIPEFYVGSILAVTMSDPNASGKTNRFVGICIQRGGKGLGATFVLRNIINNQGVELCYEMYNPRIQEIQVLKLEKRLDDNLMYLRDALPQYSTVDPDMKPTPYSPAGEVPVNMLKVKMRPRPWSKRWERPKYNVQGIRFDLCMSPARMENAQKWAMPWVEYDMLKEYDTSKAEEQIYSEVQQEMSKLKAA
ncbi:39S ribosomal protein L19, mitochondrial [Dunckerocampus dactyliophorus]|uniref:39S ribosomal protein L19, mitochondrial n=1 Tax=Dunckerocampus dactyliophorus TaxID=161453 RepID=UPI002404CB68|nr:39S ribosomal protein L19, mitochondrial [Dunckerocampus dactyliophorus]